MTQLENSRIQDFDSCFYATKESQGFINATLAIKYVLFDDETVFKDTQPIANKYLYISSKENARKKAMLLQQDDLAHILVQYCMQSFGLRNKNFTISDDDFTLALKRIDRLDISAYEMIEYVSYAAMGNLYAAYQFLFANRSLLISVVDYMMEERYVGELKEILDAFSGIIDSPEVDTKTKYAFYDAYTHIDEHFAEIKRNNPEYIK